MLEHPTGSDAGFTRTTAGGSYAFRGIAEQAWTIQPSLIGDLDGSVNEMDAATILSAAAGEITLGTAQTMAADVTGRGSVSATDAAFVLQRATGLTHTFPVSIVCNSDWVFFPAPADAPPFGMQTVVDPDVSLERCVPGSITLDPVVGEIGDRDFMAIAFGDVDSSWTSIRAGEGARSSFLSLGRPRLRGTSAQVPIEIKSRRRFRALHLVIGFDPQAIAFVSIRPSPESRDALVAANDLAVNDEKTGILIVGAASAQLIEAEFPFTLEFELLRPGRYPDIWILESQIGPL
jgi:hypothetical protein